MKCFKVVTKDFDRLVSYIDTLPPGLLTTYIPGEWVEAPVGGLICCNSEYAAANMAFGSAQVWEAEGEEFMELPINWHDPFGLHGQEDAGRYWDEEGSRDDCFKDGWPPGTIAFKRIKLVRRVEVTD